MRKFLAFCADAFRHGYEEARAQSGARAQPAPLAGFLGETEDEIKATIASGLRGAFDAGRQVERDRIAEILQASGAEELPQLAMFLVLGDATAVQATSILAKAENDASKRIAMTRAQQIEPAIPTLH
jgi:hypothetical protein